MTRADPGRSILSAAAIRFRLAGIPIEISPTFLIVVALLGFVAQREGLHLVLWVVVATLAILGHELGHAAAFLRFGVRPSIRLVGIVGLTQGRDVGALRGVVVSLAGPAVGIVVGLAALGLTRATSPDGLAALVVADVVFTNLVWAIFNLVPILPLDGGATVAGIADLIRPGRGRQIAALISIVTAIALVPIALSTGFIFAALFLGVLGFANVSALGAIRDQPAQSDLDEARQAFVGGDTSAARVIASTVETGRTSGSTRADARSIVAWSLIREGRLDTAREVIRRPGSEPDAVLVGILDLVDRNLARPLANALGGATEAIPVIGTSVAVDAWGRVDELLEAILDLTPSARDRATAVLQWGLLFGGRHEASLRVGELGDARAPSSAGAVSLASSAAALGRTDEAVAWLERAADRGYATPERLEADANLRSILADPRLADGVARIRANAAGPGAVRDVRFGFPDA